MGEGNFWATRNGRYVITVISCVAIWGLFLAAALADRNLGSLFALICIYFGWRALNRIQPAMFIWMPVIGWIIYFVVKMFISYFIGIFVAPFVLSKKIAEIVADNPEPIESVVGSVRKAAGELQSAGDENATELTKGFKIWLGVILGGQAGGILINIYGIAELDMNLLSGIYMIAAGIVGISGILLMLLKHKILGFYMYAGIAAVTMVVNIMSGVGIVLAIIGAITAPAITYLFIRKNTAVIC